MSETNDRELSLSELMGSEDMEEATRQAQQAQLNDNTRQQEPLRAAEGKSNEDSPIDIEPSANTAEVMGLLDKDLKGSGKNKYEVPRTSRENLMRIFLNDVRFSDLRYNVVTGEPVRVNPKTGKRRPWLDADDSLTRTYIESVYGIESQNKYDDALRAFLIARRYNPVHAAIEATEWDGKPHAEGFLAKWMGADDTPVNRECSRLIFAGAVRRAYEPGCKFDYCIVLIGGQGGGKSTICRWLALEDDFYTSIKTIRGQKGSEGIEGKWIVEIEELLAVLANEKSGTVKEDEAKAFLSRQSEHYRKPFDRRTSDNQRTNIFIGTTNRDDFLSDPTGNRRWFPVRCNQDGNRLYDHEAECREDIRQAYAEMLAAYRKGEALAAPMADRNLEDEIRKAQESAEQESPWVGMIEVYLKEDNPEKEYVCIQELWDEAINFRSGRRDRTPAQGKIIGKILREKLGWIPAEKAFYMPVYGTQKYYKRPE